MPENVVKIAGKELRRLKKMSPQLPEYPMLRHYLELVADLPWDKSSTEHIDIRKAKQVFMLYTLVLTSQKSLELFLFVYVSLINCSDYFDQNWNLKKLISELHDVYSISIVNLILLPKINCPI